MPKVSRNRIQNAISAGLVLINGKIIKPSYKISGSETILLRIPKVQDHSEIIPEDIPLDVIYEDADLMVINKKPGMIVHPAQGVYSGTLVNALAYYFQQQKIRMQQWRRNVLAWCIGLIKKHPDCWL